MDDRKPPDTNVVSLRRKDDPDAERRKQLASTIFADEDEIATFSRGNLVPPRPSDAAADEGHRRRPTRSSIATARRQTTGHRRTADQRPSLAPRPSTSTR